MAMAWCMFVIFAIVAGSAASIDLDTNVLKTKDTRIVSGWEAREGQFPYMLYLRTVTQFGTVSACAGSIIHAHWGLTSARCVATRITILARGGSVDINQPQVYLESHTYFTSPDFIDEIYQISQPFDIGLVYFERGFTFSNTIQPIRLQRSADRDRDYSGVLLTTSGWGTMWSAESPTPDILQWVHLVGVSNFMCLLMFNNNFLVRTSSICAGPYNVTSQGMCSGDSGVPLTVVDVDGAVSLVGVGSFVHHWGCNVGMPSGYVRPGYFHDWIRSVTGINFDWGQNFAADAPTAQSMSVNIPTAKSPVVNIPTADDVLKTSFTDRRI